jgi:hypothetical protein
MSDKKEFKEIDDLIFKSVGKSVDRFIIKEPSYGGYISQNIKDSGYHLRKIIGPTQRHADGPEVTEYSDGLSYRVATLVISLAGTGDTLEFPDLGVNIPLDEGTVVFFPPYWTHIHESKWSGVDTYRIQTWITNN